jgi:flagellin-specific chaperone FliS
MKPHKVYTSRKLGSSGWTRIDMLLALYNAAIDALEQAQLAQQQDDPSAAASQLVRANKVILGIISGLDLDASPEDGVAGNICRLAVFALDRIREGDAEAALGVLRTLRDGYEGICEEARELERRGAIPPLETKAVDFAEA